MRTGVAAILLIVVITGCADSGPAGNGKSVPENKQPGLVAALSRVRATDSTRQYIEYGNVGATRALAETDLKRLGPLHLVVLR